MSAFEIEEQRYSVQPMKEYGEVGMSARLGKILQPGMAFSYEYDFGSTTELELKVIGMLARGKTKGAVELLARNDAPPVVCQLCGAEPATQICSECAWKDKGWLCQGCAKSHACGTEMCLPVVNSPRAGVCAYAG